MDKVVSMMDRLPYEKRLRIIGVDALWTELEKWREIADKCEDQQFVKKTREVIMMLTQGFCSIIDTQDGLLAEQAEEIADLKGGENKNG